MPKLETRNHYSISIIVPMHNEAAVINSFFKSIIPILEQLKHPYEIICVSDGSTDKTVELLLLQQQPQIKVIEFSRNFGKEAAIIAGLQYCQGDVAIPIDADLQHPPTLIQDMLAKWQQGYDLVIAARRQRKEGIIKKITSKLFYHVFNLISNTNLVPQGVDFRLLDRNLINNINQMPEKNRFFKGQSVWLTNNYCSVLYDEQKNQRASKWRLHQLWRFAIDAITSFSSLPLRVWSYIGCSVSLIAFIYMTIIIIKKLVFGDHVSGYASMMVTILFLGGIQLISLGIIGEYISRIFIEVKQRPLYIIKNRYGFTKEPDMPDHDTLHKPSRDAYYDKP